MSGALASRSRVHESAARGWIGLALAWAWALLLGIALLPGAAIARDPAALPAADIAVDRLPPEARVTLALIRTGGPFPYDKDGTVFGNREGLLPRQPRGYYREYTVKTPGSRDRGARRIVAGGDAQRPADLWYTDDHYRSFRRIRE
jgi:ribonuclease T1